MKLFQPVSTVNIVDNRRVLISCEAPVDDVCAFLAKTDLFTSDQMLVLDVAKNISRTKLSKLDSEAQTELYLYIPSRVTDIYMAFEEFSQLGGNPVTQKTLRTSLLINDLESLMFLHRQNFSPVNMFDKLQQLKYLPQRADVFLLNANHSYTDHVLADWYNMHLEFTAQQQCIVKYSNVMGFGIGEELTNPARINNVTEFSEILQKSKQTQEISPTIAPTTAEVELDNSLYPEQTSPVTKQYLYIVERLNSAKHRDDLIELRQEIQSFSSSLSNDEKSQLNSIYKLSLQRIKMLEETSVYQSRASFYE